MQTAVIKEKANLTKEPQQLKVNYTTDGTAPKGKQPHMRFCHSKMT